MTAGPGAFQLGCTDQGSKGVAPATTDSITFSLTVLPFVAGDDCTLIVFAAFITDIDAEDPPDNMAADEVISFIIAAPPVAALPLLQDWTNTGLITANDNWSGVSGITGFLGQGITGATGADPQVLLSVSTVANDLDVIAQALTTNASGGVGEFDSLANPVVGLQGSGTADAPYLLFSVDTTGASHITMAYNLRDVDGTADNAVQPVALQYRIGSSGPFTNLAAGFVADATMGPSLATQVTPVSVILPADANDEPLVQIRVMTTNAVGNDEWVGIDDISIAADDGDVAPSINATIPADAATGVPIDGNISIEFSEPVDVAGTWFTLQLRDVWRTHRRGVRRSVNFRAQSRRGLCRQRIVLGHGLRLAGHRPGRRGSAGQHGRQRDVLVHDRGAVLGDPYDPGSDPHVAARRLVSQHDGDRHRAQHHDRPGSRLLHPGPESRCGRRNLRGNLRLHQHRPDGRSRRCRGRAAGRHRVPRRGRQQPDQDPDRQPDHRGPVDGQSPAGDHDVGLGGRVPPTTVIDDDATGDVETSGSFDAATDGIDFYESLESMRVQVNNPVAVGPTSSNREIWVLADDGAGAGVRTYRGGIIVRPTDFNPERIQLDDTLLASSTPNVNVGDHFSGPAVGIVDYNFSTFEVNLTSILTAVSAGLAREVATAPGPNELAMATYNVENLDANDPQSKFDNLASQIVNNLLSPDVIALEEIQDNNGVTNNGIVDADQTLARLIAAIDAADAGPGPVYDYRQINPVNNQDGGVLGGNIRVGFLFRTDRGLAFVDRPGGGSTDATTIVNNSGIPALSFSPGRVDSGEYRVGR